MLRVQETYVVAYGVKTGGWAWEIYVCWARHAHQTDEEVASRRDPLRAGGFEPLVAASRTIGEGSRQVYLH